MEKHYYKSVFISDIHLGHPQNQGDKLIKFLDSIEFDNLIIVGDFIDFWQLNQFGKWGEKEKGTLNYINNLSKNGVNITYIQGNHDRKLKKSKEIQIENMRICREIYYKTLDGKTYYVTHGDCIDGVDNNLNDFIGQLGNFIFGGLSKLESFWNKKCSFTKKLENYIKKTINPEPKIKKKSKVLQKI